MIAIFIGMRDEGRGMKKGNPFLSHPSSLIPHPFVIQ
jgi:hypothetical protein